MSAEEIIEEMREIAKNDSGVIEKFKEYDISLDDIDTVYIDFVSLPVSAKTKDKKIYLNEKFLEKKEPIEFSIPYVIHELMHYLQQKTGKVDRQEQEGEDYLDKDTEEEAFSAQVDFKQREESPAEALRYVEQLLDHHDIDGKERKEKKEELLG
ncbi:MAG TPA: hypothetical protein ENH99_00355 [Candidatus Pacearchaeota archaeon]|nr:hypothetical protein [Candidatus Pacearchaeota archaeon]